MNTQPDDLTVHDLLQLKAQQMLFPNPEYQRGAVWTPAQKKKLVDSVLRGYPIPLFYLHHIRQTEPEDWSVKGLRLLMVNSASMR